MLPAIHAINTASNDVGYFVTVSRVVGNDSGVSAGNHGGVTVGMLQSFTGEGGASRSCANHEAADHLVPSQPYRVSGALEAKHGVEDIERDDWLPVGCIA